MLSAIYVSKKHNEEGFTLLELLIVVIVIGILAAIALPIFLNQQRAAVDASVQSDVRNSVAQLIGAQATNEATFKATSSRDNTTLALVDSTDSARSKSITGSGSLNTPASGDTFTLSGSNPTGGKFQGPSVTDGKTFAYDGATGKFSDGTAPSTGGGNTGGGAGGSATGNPEASNEDVVTNSSYGRFENVKGQAIDFEISNQGASLNIIAGGGMSAEKRYHFGTTTATVPGAPDISDLKYENGSINAAPSASDFKFYNADGSLNAAVTSSFANGDCQMYADGLDAAQAADYGFNDPNSTPYYPYGSVGIALFCYHAGASSFTSADVSALVGGHFTFAGAKGLNTIQIADGIAPTNNS